MSVLLNDRYELAEVIGSGGMGAVHRATDRRLGREVAIKVLRGGPTADETARARMRSEASLAASIGHPGVARIYDFYEGDEVSAGSMFIVMELIEGHSLAQLLRERGAMAPDQVMSVVVQVAEGLQAAHEAGIVHRDLKPANIMLTPAGRTVLVDFGIARSTSSDPLTGTGVLLGTADYISPEQAAGRSATPQSDLYALGVVAHHCLTGVSPFRRESPVATAVAHLNDPLPDLGPHVSADVAALIASLTAKDPADRPTTAAAVALQAAAIGAAGAVELPETFEQSAPAVTHQPEAPSATAVHVSPASESLTVAASRRRRPAVVYAGVGALVLCLALLGVQTMRAGGDPAVVPDVVGMGVDDATSRVRDAGMTVKATTVDAGGTPAGEVVDQSPDAGEDEPGDDRVTLSVSSGKVLVAADEVIGTEYPKAAAILAALGFEVVRRDVTRTSKAGTVVAVDRSGRVPYGATLTVSVAVAPVAASPSSASSGGAGSTTAKAAPSAKSKPAAKGGKKGRSKGKAKK